MTTCLGKSCSFGLLCVCLSCTFIKYCVCPSFPSGFEGGMRNVIVLIPDHYVSMYFANMSKDNYLPYKRWVAIPPGLLA